MKETPLVSICCMTYNQEKYVCQTIEGFLIQKTNFPFEIIIHDDASTDKTPEIIREYSKKYPNLIIPVFQKENQYYKKKNGTNLTNYVLPLTSGKYLAICEGDDYWVNPLKLQIQVDFLEKHPDYNFSMGRVDVLIEKTGNIKKRKDRVNPNKKNTYFLKDYIKTPFSQTSSFVFRNSKEAFPHWFSQIHAEDQSIVVLKTGTGKIMYHPDLFSIYRVHETSISFTAKYNIHEKYIETLKSWKNYLSEDYRFILSIQIIIVKKYIKFSRTENILKKIYYSLYIRALNNFLKLL